jgi:hypothetical protein
MLWVKEGRNRRRKASHSVGLERLDKQYSGVESIPSFGSQHDIANLYIIDTSQTSQTSQASRTSTQRISTSTKPELANFCKSFTSVDNNFLFRYGTTRTSRSSSPDRLNETFCVLQNAINTGTPTGDIQQRVIHTSHAQ